MSKIKNGGLDQYGAERFEQQQFGTAGVNNNNNNNNTRSSIACLTYMSRHAFIG